MTATFIMSIFVNIGMWFERFVIIVTSLHRDYLPSSWAEYFPTWVEGGLLIGSFGLFFFCYFLFAKFLPTINIFEVKMLLDHPEKPEHITVESKTPSPAH
jgi:molybdopterin-containing oxidoreductase family membrane subunit